MIKIGYLREEPDAQYKRTPWLLDVMWFKGDEVCQERPERHELEAMAKYYCDTRNIKLVNKLEWDLVTSKAGTDKQMTEMEVRSILTDFGYTRL